MPLHFKGLKFVHRIVNSKADWRLFYYTFNRLQLIINAIKKTRNTSHQYGLYNDNLNLLEVYSEVSFQPMVLVATTQTAINTAFS